MAAGWEWAQEQQYFWTVDARGVYSVYTVDICWYLHIKTNSIHTISICHLLFILAICLDIYGYLIYTIEIWYIYIYIYMHVHILWTFDFVYCNIIYIWYYAYIVNITYTYIYILLTYTSRGWASGCPCAQGRCVNLVPAQQGQHSMDRFMVLGITVWPTEMAWNPVALVSLGLAGLAFTEFNDPHFLHFFLLGQILDIDRIATSNWRPVVSQEVGVYPDLARMLKKCLLHLNY